LTFIGTTVLSIQSDVYSLVKGPTPHEPAGSVPHRRKASLQGKTFISPEKRKLPWKTVDLYWYNSPSIQDGSHLGGWLAFIGTTVLLSKLPWKKVDLYWYNRPSIQERNHLGGWLTFIGTTVLLSKVTVYSLVREPTPHEPAGTVPHRWKASLQGKTFISPEKRKLPWKTVDLYWYNSPSIQDGSHLGGWLAFIGTTVLLSKLPWKKVDLYWYNRPSIQERNHLGGWLTFIGTTVLLSKVTVYSLVRGPTPNEPAGTVPHRVLTFSHNRVTESSLNDSRLGSQSSSTLSIIPVGNSNSVKLPSSIGYSLAISDTDVPLDNLSIFQLASKEIGSDEATAIFDWT
jgi:hypothetical protein